MSADVLAGGGSGPDLVMVALPSVQRFISEARNTANAYGETTAEPARRASPLWIRAIGAGREWRLLSFAFQAKFLPGGAHLWHDSRRGKELQVTDNDVKRQTDQWIKALREDKTFVPYRHDDGTVEPDERRSTGDLRR